ncbi:hypothetical protein Pint_07933 [Pistacia integerrima]|uniref:Uncharacterized protein n=1 Tax=Pistacia integerrima TaxID=434235 RepID=A0ACC0XXG1_9ROSI|nr:hypothetical protein Pint_07933 [Pistacia integerrima]
MKGLLFVKRLHLLVLVFASEKPNSKSDEEWEFEHEQVCGYIRQWVEDNVVNHIADETHARTLWYKLETLYASKTRNNKLILLKQAGLWLFNTLSDCWENFRVSLTNFAPNGIVTMEYVKSGVLNEEVRRKTQGSSSSHSEVLVTKNMGRSKSKGQGQNGRGKSRSNSRSKYKNLESHYSGYFGTIKMSNDGLAKVIGIGDVCLEMDNGSSLLLRGVNHIPDIRLNLISTGILDDKGYCNTFSDGQWKLTRGVMVVARGKKLYERSKLDMKTRQSIFIGYVLDEFGYRLYDPVEKKLVRSCDVMFMEDQTIQDVEK